eukprot:TRINITY_DN35664_c0_g1_i1.p1 TRINITY_DN35664_c0_g1~~TRINITY_DN35664_c0_g1_i1.p1  ORF type:complete len:187 (-),score=24.02 TRINITY_DN35664_c0_g1_i1:63-623(-)
MWQPSLPLRWQDGQLSEPEGGSPFLTPRYARLRYGQSLTEDEIEMLKQVPLEPQRITDGCTARAAMGGIGGSVLGLLMGGFFHTMAPPTMVDTSLSTFEQIRLSYKGFGQACTRSARQFGKFGVVYAGVECAMERERASMDLQNAIYAGCITGGIIAFQGGPGAMAMSCGGLAAFSAVIEMVMGHH